MNINELIKTGESILADAGIHDASSDARELMSFITGKDRSGLIIHLNSEMSDEDMSKYLKLINVRASHVPLQHITGEQEFMGFRFRVTKDVLVPRMDTEVLVEEAAKRAILGAKILDLCTGSGIIGIALKRICFGAEVTLSDVSEEALVIAGENAEANGADVKIIRSDMFDAFDTGNKFSMIVSNPPYIPEAVIAELDPEVKDHDPETALNGGEDGLNFYRKIAEEACNYLIQGGWLLLEIGYDQADAVKDLIIGRGEYCSDIKVVKDFGGNDRVIIAKRK